MKDKQPLAKPKHKPQLRADVAWALYQILDKGKSSRDILPIGLSRQKNAKDKAWFQEALYSVLRNVPLYQMWTNLLLSKPIVEKDKIVERIIMVGLLQLHSMRTPDHAAISETVNASKTIGKPKYSGLINALLRRFLRENMSETPLDKPHIKYGMPKWLLKQIQVDYPDQWQDIAEKSNTHPPIFLRINKLRIDPKDFKNNLKSSNIQFTEFSETCVKLNQSVNIAEMEGYEEGAFSVQDMAAQQCAELLDAKDNEVVLDCCAAPGGKTSAIFEKTPSIKKIVAIDNVAARIEKMRANLKRLKHHSNKIQILQDDASSLAKLDKTELFDKILLDAPCSATGIIRRHPDIKWLRKRDDIEALVDLQQKILEQTWQRLKEGGTLLYATCSILKDENVNQIKTFLARHEDSELIKITSEESNEHPGWQVLPGQQDMDGFYYAKIIKRTVEKKT